MTSEKDVKIENIGLAVFNGGTLVGELNAIETVCHLLITNDLNTCSIAIPDPYNEEKSLSLFLSISDKNKIEVDLLNGTPYINIKVFTKARILSISKDSKYLNEENLDKIEQYANSYLESNISNYLYKTSKEFNSDISGIGKYAVKKFLTQQSWNDYNWQDNYRNAFFNVEVTTGIKSSYMLSET